ncbi:MAG: efflux RND transporter periplasmic adaptor subunit [Opitutales bacterium]|jgi:membrane fusion protein, heavy metal efflux system|nr:efflux RND transporter periplasmic adaptor subunit [Opitutales bacterium]MDP4643622.1 efflux RND transporter periplasmic adaptor subunit [Opitutales bacterium]MDP4776744.1 efflux RND transporter periplasmic adaptor subunit [Opitutales bacterium]MDP4883716.1 efflux RND transporter periplasmic adaptor subunit [Opitutales bacterium]MDP5080658.1 efflux RND transporter periplasmic adaptor subunit [Opitutales bacterium]
MKLNKILSFVALLSITNVHAAEETSGKNIIILDDAAVKNLRIQTEEAEERDFESTVFAIGRIEEIPSRRSVLSSRIAGRISALNTFEGDVVEAGDVLATVESRQLGDPPPSVELKAPQGGLVVASHVRLGQPVEPSAELLDISDRLKLWAVAKIPEQEAAQTKIGTRARIHIPALGDELIEATLTRFGVEADRQSGTVEGIFELDNTNGKLRPGMRAEFSIVLKTKPFVLSIPRSAIQGDPASRVIFVKDFDLPNAFVRVPVVLGEENDQYIEVIRGVFPGDEVVIQGSYVLSFVGGGSGMSLKEALDAAHGHEHAEDGSELGEGEESTEHDDGHDHEGANEHGSHSSLPLMIYAGVMTLISLITLQMLMKRRQEESEAEDA